MTESMITKESCLQAAGRAITVGLMRSGQMSVREAAEAAYIRGGPSVEELEAKIRARRRAAKARHKAAA